MTRTFAYCRCSKISQTTDNQIHEIAAAGFQIEPHRIVTETISGSVEAKQRPLFSRLMDKLETGDMLVVTKIDRLGRNAMDVRSTIEELADRGVSVYCLALGGVDLTSPTGKMTMAIVASFAEFEKDLLIERVNAGLKRAKAEGVKLGRPAKLSQKQKEEIKSKKAEGATVYGLAKAYGVDRAMIYRTVRL